MELLCRYCGISFVRRRLQGHCSRSCASKDRPRKRGVCPKHGIILDRFFHCQQCKKESDKRYSISERGRLLNRERTKRYMSTKEGRQQNNAHQSVLLARRKGLLIISPCVVCNDPIAEAHHLFGYDKENHLRIVFLCHKHHTIANKDPIFNEKLKLDFPPSV
jgi:hypothetical protein